MRAGRAHSARAVLLVLLSSGFLARAVLLMLPGPWTPFCAEAALRLHPFGRCEGSASLCWGAGGSKGAWRRYTEGMGYVVYIVECADGTFYTGITTDFERRLAEHNAGAGAKYTRSRCPVSPVFIEQHPDRSSASRREREIKLMTRRQKEELVAGASSSEHQPSNTPLS